MSKRTLGGTKRKALRVSGFRARMKTHSGKILYALEEKKVERI